MKRIFLFTFVFIVVSFNAFAAHLISVDKALKKVYRKATVFEKKDIMLSEEQITYIEDHADVTFSGSHSNRLIMYEVYENNLPAGYAYEDVVIGKWGPIHYLAGLDTEGAVLQIVILDYDEIRGKPIAKRRFLKQYKGKNFGDPLKLRKDIDGITGATISSRSLTDGIRKIVNVHNFING